jgi:hypothetical protein
MNPFVSLLKSRKFLLAMLDVVVSMATYFITKYAAPALADDVLFVLGGLQPVFVTIIAAIAYEDGQAKKAGTFRY